MTKTQIEARYRQEMSAHYAWRAWEARIEGHLRAAARLQTFAEEEAAKARVYLGLE
jgi:hypothetical protein